MNDQSNIKNTSENSIATDPSAQKDGTDTISSTDSDTAEKAAETPKAASKRLDPTRYGDWEKNGRCIDF